MKKKPGGNMQARTHVDCRKPYRSWEDFMKARTWTTALVLAAVGYSGSVLACGDKYLSVGLGSSFRRTNTERKAAAVLIYADTNSDLSRSLKTLGVEASMNKEGYRPTIVSTAAELDAVIQNRPWAVLVIDGSDQQTMSKRAAVAAGPHLVPVFTRPTKVQLKQARKEYETVIDTPTKARVFVDAVDDAMDLHEMEVAAAAKAAKKLSR
jgi:hypothetical protein